MRLLGDDSFKELVDGTTTDRNQEKVISNVQISSDSVNILDLRILIMMTDHADITESIKIIVPWIFEEVDG